MGKKSKSDRPMDRLRSVSKLQWGSMCIIGGIAANILVPMIMRMGPAPANSAAARGQALGVFLASALFVVTGIVLIILHFIGQRGEPRKGKQRNR